MQLPSEKSSNPRSACRTGKWIYFNFYIENVVFRMKYDLFIYFVLVVHFVSWIWLSLHFIFLHLFILLQMVSQRQRIEASPSRMFTDSVPSPPSYEEASGIWSSQTMEGSTDSMGYFLGEVCLFLSLFPSLILFYTWYSCRLSTNVS